MVRKRVDVRGARRAAKVSGLGLAFFLLTNLTSTWAQQGTAVPALPSAAASKERSAPAAPSQAPKTPVGEYIVSPEDLLDVNVLDVPEVTRTYRVSSNGFLTLPLLPEPIPAAGETLDQLSHLIATKFHDAGMLNNAQVYVSLRETRLHTVLVSGEVKIPQSYPIFGPTRLLDVLVQAGGLTDGAGNDAIIMRGDIGARADMEESAQIGCGEPLGQGAVIHFEHSKAGGDGRRQDQYPPLPRGSSHRPASRAHLRYGSSGSPGWIRAERISSADYGA